MKLEAVNPLLPEEVCIATITAVRGSHLWLQLEGKGRTPGSHPEAALVCFSWSPHKVACYKSLS